MGCRCLFILSSQTSAFGASLHLILSLLQVWPDLLAQAPDNSGTNLTIWPCNISICLDSVSQVTAPLCLCLMAFVGSFSSVSVTQIRFRHLNGCYFKETGTFKINVLTEAGGKAIVRLWISLVSSRTSNASYEPHFCERRGLKVDTETHIVLPGCTTKCWTHELLKEDGYGIRFQEGMKKDGQKGAKKI